MRRLSLILLAVCGFLSVNLFADSPHGKDFKISCGVCHSSNGWKLDKTIYSFDHNKTAFPLLGRHQPTDCKACHPTLVFSEAKTACVDCHTDMHNQTVGPDCGRCHTPDSWIVNNITEIHQRGRFPLTGSHYTADCSGCHPSASLLRFEPLGVECYDCHRKDYEDPTNNPNHITSNFDIICTKCHTTNPGWKPAEYREHDNQFFPVYAGKHVGTWNTCADCHSNPANYASFTCISCHGHNQPDMDSKHSGVGGYTYVNFACFECHPRGDAQGSFNHYTSAFPLTGAHIATPCINCHVNGYPGTPTACSDCHMTAYNQATDPNHAAIGIPFTCATCHTTNPGWKPAAFPDHDTYFPLTGAHTTAGCNSCHANGYAGTPTACSDCHMTAYNQTTDPNHAAIGIPITCATCHTTNPGWKPAAFPDHNTYFPLTGAHTTAGCNSCHANGYAGTPTACSACHIGAYNQTTNPNHTAAGIPTTCGDCHTTNPGWKPASFPDHNNYYPLTGAHATVDCYSCHQNNYSNTPNTCVGCHQNNYNQTTNPSHPSLGLSTNCTTCHTTNPGWQPALFPNHNNYYVVAGAHLTLTCDACHNGNYNNTPNTCVGCHLNDYNQTNNPPHASAQFPTNCESCHTQNAWVPSTFNHDGQYFPIYSGKHNGQWNLCSDCHTNPGNYQVFSCFSCHSQPDMDDKHNGVSGYSYNSNACYQCHPNGNAPMMKSPKINRKQN